MKLVPLVLVAAVSLTSCVAKVGAPGSDVPVLDRSLRIPEVGEHFDYVVPSGGVPPLPDVTVLRVEGESVLVRVDYGVDRYRFWIDWQNVLSATVVQ